MADLAPGTVLHGELVIWNGEQTDFSALQHRITAGIDETQPANLVAFDLLQHPTRGAVLSLPLSARIRWLTDLLADASPTLGLCPQTADIAVADNWMADWTQAGIEGVMIKAAAGRYRLGGRAWRKRRATQTIDQLIGGITGTLDHPTTLLLARRTGTHLAYVGHTTPLSEHASADVAELLALSGVTPTVPTWPRPLPARWIGYHQEEPLAYLPVTPTATIEVIADRAFEHGRYRHPYGSYGSERILHLMQPDRKISSSATATLKRSPASAGQTGPHPPAAA